MLSVSIFSHIANSLEQQPFITITNNPNSTHNVRVGISDNPALQEYTSQNSVRDMYNQQILDLKAQLQKSEDTNTFLTVLAIVVGVLATIGGTLIGYFQTRHNFKSETMLALFKIINAENVKLDKKKLADQWNKQKSIDENGNPTKPDEKVTFENFKEETMKVFEAYNQVGALYELKLIDKKHFRHVYGGNMVRTYNLAKEHIEWWRRNGNSEYCLHFENVAKDLMKDRIFRKGIKAPVYKDKSNNHT